ncbi:MAG TPA: hypothetical protein PLN24_08970 [Victivallales bacterium]|nr:hypothetical protein [Victivallales bacterium]HOK05370.1 hypothetical protein [Victivallales bacterium]
MKTTGEERLRKSGMSEADIKIFIEDRERAKNEMDLFLKEQEDEDKEREKLKKEYQANKEKTEMNLIALELMRSGLQGEELDKARKDAVEKYEEFKKQSHKSWMTFQYKIPKKDNLQLTMPEKSINLARKK